MTSWVERQRWILDFTLASLLRRKAKNLSLLAVYALVVFAVASVLLLTRSLRDQSLRALRGAPEIVVQRMTAGRHDLAPPAYVDAAKMVRGVTGARGRLWGYYFDAISGANYTVLVPDAFWGQRGDVVVGPGVARVRRLQVGDLVDVRAADDGYLRLRVIEVVPHEGELVASDLILVGEADFRRWFGLRDGRFTDVAVKVRNSREVDTVVHKLLDGLPDARAITRAGIARTYTAAFDWRSGLVVTVLAGAVLAFVVVAWDKASGLSAEEQREIGVLKAIGWDTADVLLVKFWEGVVVSLTAFAVGALAAYAHVYLGHAALLRPALEGWSALYPDLDLAPTVSALEIATLLFLTVVPYTVATIVPSWRAATADPDAIMRT
jgi:ABC-type lipoprotein release transport system permease subunit